MCYRQRPAIFIDLDLHRVTRNQKLCILLRMISFLLLDHSILKYGHQLLFIESLLFNSKSSIVSFFRSFLTLQTCWKSFRLENLLITVSVVLPTGWQALYCQEKYRNLVFQRSLKLSPPELFQKLPEECPQYQDIHVLNTGLPSTVSPK